MCQYAIITVKGAILQTESGHWLRQVFCAGPAHDPPSQPLSLLLSPLVGRFVVAALIPFLFCYTPCNLWKTGRRGESASLRRLSRIPRRHSRCWSLLHWHYKPGHIYFTCTSTESVGVEAWCQGISKTFTCAMLMYFEMHENALDVEELVALVAVIIPQVYTRLRCGRHVCALLTSF